MDEEVEQMIEDCENRESKMTEWERGFIQSIREQLDRGKSIFSEGQRETLDQIWEKVT